MLIRLIYSSKLFDQVSWTDILEIVNQSKVANAENNITGILISHQQEVIQVLEGDSHAVSKLFFKISQDKRHSSVQLISSIQIINRHFSQWKMKEVNIARLVKAKFGWIKKLLIEQNSEEGFQKYHFPDDALLVYNLLKTVYAITLDTC